VFARYQVFFFRIKVLLACVRRRRLTPSLHGEAAFVAPRQRRGKLYAACGA
jgi:hypothetical protein